jgi:8-oxo-dGTP pyrophosphatase MutT (NUDIX family)
MKSRRSYGRKKRKPEMLTAYDDDMQPIGDFYRPVVHYNEMWHMVAQCWMIGKDQDGLKVYLQRRSFEKRSNPGRYDIAAGGHVSAGESPEIAMSREIWEETGLILRQNHLDKVGVYKEVSGHDHEIANIYVHFENNPPFRPGEEVIYMVQANLADFKALSEGKVDSIVVTPIVRKGTLDEEAFRVTSDNFCNHKSFLEMVYPYIIEHYEDRDIV